MGDEVHKKIQNKTKILILTFTCYSCSIDLKRHSEHSGLRPDTNSFVYFSFVNSKIKFLCSSESPGVTKGVKTRLEERSTYDTDRQVK